MKYIRKCPLCDTEITYARKQAINKAEREKSNCKSCASSGEKNAFFGKKHSQNTINNWSKTKKGKPLHTQQRKDFLKIDMTLNNPMAGKSFYDVWLTKFGKEEADRRMLEYKKNKSIKSSGKGNSMYGRPSPTGSGNGWSGWYKKWFFRSIHELSFIINYIERFNMTCETAEKNEYKISYIDFEGVKRNYFPDFIIEKKYLIECKPKKLQKTRNVILKKEAAIRFCDAKNIKYKMIDPILITEEKVKELYLSKTIRFLEKYEKKFIEKYMK